MHSDLQNLLHDLLNKILYGENVFIFVFHQGF